MNRKDELRNVMSEITKKQNESREKAKQKTMSKENLSALILHWTDAYKANFKFKYALTAKEKGQLKMLLNELGFQEAALMITLVFERWDGLKLRFQVNGNPTVGFVFGFRKSLVGISFGDFRDEKDKAERGITD